MVLFASFVIPLVALGAALGAAAIPILIHLLSRRRVQIVEWAAMRFLLSAQKRRQRRVDRWLLLAVRIVALLALVAGMAAATPWAESLWQMVRPGVPEYAAGRPRTHHILVVDSSLSMAAKNEDGKTRFESAIAKAEQTVNAAQAGDGFSLLHLSGSAEVVIPGPTNDPQKVLAELKALTVSHGTADLIGGLNQIAETLGRSPQAYPRKQISVFTDLQRSAWAGLLPRSDGTYPEIWRNVTRRADFVLVDTAEKEVPNVAVVELTTSDPVALVDSYTAVTIIVQNFGRTDLRQVRVELTLARPTPAGAELIFLPVEQRLIDVVPAGQRVAVTFALEGTARFREPGLHLVQAKLLDRDDALPIDDLRTLAVEVRESLPVLVVNGKSASESGRRSEDFLPEALAPSGKRVSGNPIRPKSIGLAEFSDPVLGDLTNIDCVILNDVPLLTPMLSAKLATHLKRGGGIIVGFGPTTAANVDGANRTLWVEGEGLLPGKIGELVEQSGTEALGFRLVADDTAYRRPPLSAFRDDNVRAGLTTVPFRRYLKLDAPPDGRAARVLSFASAEDVKPKPLSPAEKSAAAPLDPAVVEWSRGRGKILVFTSSFNADWNDWPILPTYLPFVHELVRHAAISGERRTLRVHDSIEEFFPVTMVGSNAVVQGPDGLTATVPIAAVDEAGLARFPETPYAGLYRVTAPGKRERIAAVNPADATPGGGSESDLRRVEAEGFSAIPAVRIAVDPTIPVVGGDDEPIALTPKPHGPTVARWILAIALLLLLAEPILAWFFGPARSASAVPTLEPAPKRTLRHLLLALGGIALLSAALAVLGVRGHDLAGGRFLSFLPESLRDSMETMLGVPAGSPGESTRIQLDSTSVFSRNARFDLRILIGLAIVGLLSTAWLYRREAAAAGGLRRIALPLALRLATLGLLLFWVLPQVLLAFNREGKPDVVVLLDTSASMAALDDFQTPEIRAKAEELRALAGISTVDRLRLAQLLLTRNNGEFLTKLLTEKQVKVHVYTMADQTKLVKELIEAGELPEGITAIDGQRATGDSSRLGDAILAVLKAFRGGSLEAVIASTDGVVTDGEDLSRAGREAARAGVPLYLIGIGEARDLPDTALSDLRAEEVVLKNDTLQFELRLGMKGLAPNGPAPTVPVILSERIGDKLIERARENVPLDASGRPVVVQLNTVPTEAGERTYVIEVSKQPGEMELGNNRLERVVMVTENKRIKVLLLESYPRYEFRFLKVLLERESDTIRGNKSIELSSYLLEASAGYAEQDKSALRDLPTKTELMTYDVVLFGDIDPAQLPKANAFFADLADFVKVRGGGVLFIAGTQANPQKLFATALAEVLPVAPLDGARADKSADGSALVEGWKLKPTPYGRSHPLLRFTSDDAENAKFWASLKPMFWSAGGYVRKPAAEVLAVHPDLPAPGGAAGENQPIVLQQFYGSGRVLFFAFDETWRWRFRTAEEQYNRFWVQAIRTLARERIIRPELKTDKQTAYRKDEPIRLTAQFPDDAPPLAADASVKVTLERSGPNRETLNLQLTKVEGTRGTYQTLLARTPIGDYRFELTAPTTGVGTNKPRAEARVLPPPGERDRLSMDRAALTKAALESRGKFYTLADAENLLDDLPEFSRVPLNRPVSPLPLWNQFALFALLTAMLTTEWLLRRSAKLL